VLRDILLVFVISSALVETLMLWLVGSQRVAGHFVGSVYLAAMLFFMRLFSESRGLARQKEAAGRAAVSFITMGWLYLALSGMIVAIFAQTLAGPYSDSSQRSLIQLAWLAAVLGCVGGTGLLVALPRRISGLELSHSMIAGGRVAAAAALVLSLFLFVGTGVRASHPSFLLIELPPARTVKGTATVLGLCWSSCGIVLCVWLLKDMLGLVRRQRDPHMVEADLRET
jgi:hypothetical protein